MLTILWMILAEKGLAVSYVPEFPQYPVESVDFSHVITLQAPEAISKSDRAPVALTVVLDRSGSMVGNKIELVKKSTDFLVQQLQEGDAIGVVSYSNTVRLGALLFLTGITGLIYCAMFSE